MMMKYSPTMSGLISCKSWFVVLLSCCSLLLAGCASPPHSLEEPAPEEEALTSLEIPLVEQALLSREDAYVLQSGDEVDIQVYREPELSGTYRLSSAGEIRHAILGSVTLGGLTRRQAEERLTEQLAEDYLVNPRVIMKVTSALTYQVVIFGEVRKPGVYPLPPDQSITLLQLIAQSGGFTDLASADRVRIVREVDGKQTAIRARVADILAGRKNHADIPLNPGDVVVVPQIIF